MLSLIRFLGFIHSRWSTLQEEFNKQKELEVLMQKERVHTFFQPILSLEKGSTIGFEVLNRPETSTYFPTTEQFYDYVSSSSEVFMAERFLRNLSFERFAEQIRTSQRHKDHLVFLNIQSQVLADPSYQSGITLDLLAKHKLSPYQVVLELTEKEAVLNKVQFERMIEHYRQQGFRIAVDDAGTGYNSLQTLVSVKPEFIKLDKSLIRHIDRHIEKQHLVELLVEFALQTDTTVIAEGIETLAELRFLRCLGIHLGQGYALGKPMDYLDDGCMPIVNSAVQKQIV
ncbi:EAL domain-containing protein [Niallia oryzisoli]|uniref:EAL domain-containing protein n=1 Tax=Niallia oryzisoli TaxID=1737571 RepID=UPI0037362CC7